MVWIIGFVVLASVVLLGAAFLRTDPERLATQLRRSGPLLAILCALGLFATGRAWLGLLLLGLAGLLKARMRARAQAHRFEEAFRFEEGSRSEGAGRAPPESKMSLAEARRILGVGADASLKDINAAYRALMRNCHPDAGGSNYLASKLNEAREKLLKRHRGAPPA